MFMELSKENLSVTVNMKEIKNTFSLCFTELDNGYSE